MAASHTHRKLSVTKVLGMTAGTVFLSAIAYTNFQQGSYARIWNDLIVRPTGPFGGRFILQPIMAMTIAFFDGGADAKAGREPYFHLVTHTEEGRWERLAQGFSAVANVLCAAIILDTIYQLVVLRTFYPFETIVIAVLLGFIPYFLTRGPAARLAKIFVSKQWSIKEGNAK